MAFRPIYKGVGLCPTPLVFGGRQVITKQEFALLAARTAAWAGPQCWGFRGGYRLGLPEARSDTRFC